MAIRGLKTKIALNIALLLLISAILTGVVVVLIMQKVVISSHLKQQEKILEHTKEYLPDTDLKAFSDDVLPHPFPRTLKDLFSQSKMEFVVLLDGKQNALFACGSEPEMINLLKKTAAATLSDGDTHHQFIGMAWAVIWWHAETAALSVPIKIGIENAAVAAIIPLRPIVERIRVINRPIILYILFNTTILTLIGLYRIFRIYLRPIDRLVQQAETYGDEDDVLFTFRREDNELNKLSKALNRMLGRIAGDRQKLRESVESLARANQELKKTQNEMVRAEKMASIGRLSAGVAHEIGNPIGIVLGYLDLLKQDDLDLDEKKDFLERSEKEIQRINTVIRQLLDLSRPQHSSPQQLSINEAVEDFISAIRAQPMLDNIDINLHLDATSDRVFGDQDQLRQVLLNVTINAADAIHEFNTNKNGTISIATIDVKEDASKPPAWMAVIIKDNGPGIEPDVIKNIFDPFFTTKDTGKGTGLGLAVSYTLIEKMGGTITASSVVGEGTTLTLKLPLLPM